MKNDKTLSPKEAMFCSLYAQLGSPAEAARQTGYRKPGRVAARLLGRREIQEEVARLLDKQNCRASALALAGLERVAFGGIGDAVSLLNRGEELGREELEALDLFAVAELKSPKGGGLEMKFHDRLRALELLLKHTENRAGDAGHSFYTALERSVQTVDGDGHDV